MPLTRMKSDFWHRVHHDGLDALGEDAERRAELYGVIDHCHKYQIYRCLTECSSTRLQTLQTKPPAHAFASFCLPFLPYSRNSFLPVKAGVEAGSSLPPIAACHVALKVKLVSLELIEFLSFGTTAAHCKVGPWKCFKKLLVFLYRLPVATL